MSAVAVFAVRLGRLVRDALCAVFHDIWVTVRTLSLAWLTALVALSLITAMAPEPAAAPARVPPSCFTADPDFEKPPHLQPESITEAMLLLQAIAKVRP